MPLQEPVLPGVLESNYSAAEGRGWRDQYLTNKLMNDEFLFQASTSEALRVSPTAWHRSLFTSHSKVLSDWFIMQVLAGGTKKWEGHICVKSLQTWARYFKRITERDSQMLRAHNTTIGEIMSMEYWWNDIAGDSRSTRATLFHTQISHTDWSGLRHQKPTKVNIPNTTSHHTILCQINKSDVP